MDVFAVNVVGICKGIELIPMFLLNLLVDVLCVVTGHLLVLGGGVSKNSFTPALEDFSEHLLVGISLKYINFGFD